MVQTQTCGEADRLNKFHDPVATLKKKNTVEGYFT